MHEKEYRSSTPVNDNYKHRGASIPCQYCGTDNKKRFSCCNCGAALDPKFEKQVERFPLKTENEWRRHRVQVEERGFVEDATITPWHDGSPPVVQEEPIRPSTRTRVHEAERKAVKAVVSLKEPEVRRNPRTWIFIAGLCTAVLIAVMIAMWAYNKYTTLTGASAQVAGVSWSYSLPLEDYAPRDKEHTTEDDWWKPPSGAINIDDRSVVVRTEDIIEDVWVEKMCQKEEDNSYNDTDGTWVELIEEVDFDCSGDEPQKTGEEDIWGTKWTYQLYEWKSATPLTANGKSHDVQFPDFTPTDRLRATGPAVEKYVITFSYEDHDGELETATRTVPRSVWELVEIDQSFPAIIDGFGSLRAIADIDAEYQKLDRELR